VAHLAEALPALGYTRAAMASLEDVDLFPALHARGLGSLRAGTVPPSSVAAWLRGLRHLAPRGGVPSQQGLPILQALADNLTMAAAASQGSSGAVQHGRASSSDSRGADRSGGGGSSSSSRNSSSGSSSSSSSSSNGGGVGSKGGALLARLWSPQALADVLSAVSELGLDSSGGAKCMAVGGLVGCACINCSMNTRWALALP
jgi:hypothetical protein